jgi:hypothetical protein
VQSREAEPHEIELLTALLDQHRQHYASQPAAAQQLVAVGMTPASGAIAADELAAWTSVCRVLLNLGETITRY